MKARYTRFISIMAMAGAMVLSDFPALAFDKGDEVLVLQDTTAYFQDQADTDHPVKAGDKIMVLFHDKEKGKVYFMVTNAQGKQIALSIPAEGVQLLRNAAALANDQIEQKKQAGKETAEKSNRRLKIISLHSQIAEIENQIKDVRAKISATSRGYTTGAKIKTHRVDGARLDMLKNDEAKLKKKLDDVNGEIEKLQEIDKT